MQAAADADAAATVRAAAAAAAVAAEVAAREVLQRAHEDALRAAAEDVDDEVERLKAGYASNVLLHLVHLSPSSHIIEAWETSSTACSDEISVNKLARGDLLRHSNNFSCSKSLSPGSVIMLVRPQTICGRTSSCS